MEMMGQGQMSWLWKGDWCTNLKLALSLQPKLPNSAALQGQRMDIAESVRQAVGSTFGLRMEGLLLGQEEIKHHAVARIHAPAIFNEVYDTSKDFSWAMFGFNTMPWC